MTPLESNEFLRVSEAADYLGVSAQTLRRWDREGSLTAVRRPDIQARLDTIRTYQSPVPPPARPRKMARLGFRLSRYLVRLKRLPIRRQKLFRPLPLIAAGIILVALGVGTVYLMSGPDYRLTAAAQLLLSTPDAKLSGEVSYDAKSQQFVINGKGAEQQTAVSNPNVLVGQPSTGLYSAALPVDLAHGITITNNTGPISFTLQPEFNTAPAKREAGHFVYPAQNGMQAVYTPQADQLTEDIILNRPAGNSLTLTYHLSLPSGLHGQMTASGPEVVNSHGIAVFQFLPPVIRESNGQPSGKLAPAAARLVLSGNTLSLIASQLDRLTYPITIDPSILINSTNGFLTGNSESGITAATNQINENGLNGGIIGAWTSTTAFSASAPVMPARSAMGTVAYNGYMYVLGGLTGTVSTGDCNGAGLCNGVFYATISGGTIGSWTATTVFPTSPVVMPPRSDFSTVVYNGYLYVIGGKGTASTGDCNSAGLCGGVFDALICTGSNSGTGGCGATAGTIGNWAATTVFTGGAVMPYRYDFGAAAYNGYLYVTGGHGTASTGDCNSGGQCGGVFYASLNSDGSVGSWNATTVFTGGAVMPYRWGLSTVAYNGYLYVLGGQAGSSTGDCQTTSFYRNGVWYAPINANGSLPASSWTATSSFPTSVPNMPGRAFFGVSISNGYLYVSGGRANSSAADCTATTFFCNGIYYVPVYANGTIGAWSQSGTF